MPGRLHGLYVKIPYIFPDSDVDAIQQISASISVDDVNLYLFIFKGTAILWGKWLL